jgi:ABC-type glycerol-3-phosphate transport system substrate-binding protein
MAVWTGAEQKAFQAVLDGFTEQNPDVKVNYTAAGDQLPTQLSTAVQGGNPPDIAALPQPGLMTDFVKKGALQPIDFASSDISDNFGESVVDLGTVDGKLYGFLFKAATSHSSGTTSRPIRTPVSIRPTTGTRGSRTVTRSPRRA